MRKTIVVAMLGLMGLVGLALACGTEEDEDGGGSSSAVRTCDDIVNDTVACVDGYCVGNNGAGAESFCFCWANGYDWLPDLCTCGGRIGDLRDLCTEENMSGPPLNCTAVRQRINSGVVRCN